MDVAIYKSRSRQLVLCKVPYSVHVHNFDVMTYICVWYIEFSLVS